jgi:hypothetical protein
MALEPPPRIIEKFTTEWKDWLYFFYREQELSGESLSITNVSSDYTVVSGDEVILADPTSASFTIDIHPGVNNRAIYVKNIANTGSNIITVDAAGVETIDYELTFILDPLESIHIVYSSKKSGWFII